MERLQNVLGWYLSFDSIWNGLPANAFTPPLKAALSCEPEITRQAIGTI
jgi:hypothetical protein